MLSVEIEKVKTVIKNPEGVLKLKIGIEKLYQNDWIDFTQKKEVNK